MGRYDPINHHRRSIRLRGYDYSRPGAYFVTLCTQGRECLFGEIADEEMVLNEYGKIVEQCWRDLTNHYHNVQLDHYIVMPNHFHGIIIIKSVVTGSSVVGAGFKPAPTTTHPAPTNSDHPAHKHHGLSEFIRALKTFSSKHINQIRNTPGTPVWQRNYYEHIIRDNLEYQKITTYIRNNPKNWRDDAFYDSQRQ